MLNDATPTPTLPTEYREVQPILVEIAAASARAITTADQFVSAGDVLKRIKAAKQQIEAARVSITGPLNESLRAANAQAREATAPFDQAERAVKARMTEYSTEQERLRREKQRIADEEARAARERAERAAAEARAKAEQQARELRERAEAEAAAGREAKAAKLAARADAKVERAEMNADVLQAAAAATVAPVVITEAPKVAGVTMRQVWRFTIDDESKVPREFLKVDESKVRRYVEAMKADARIAGVRIYTESQVAARAAGGAA